MRELIRHATSLGVQVHYAHIDDDPSLLGYFHAGRQWIVLRLGLTRAQARWVLAHECGHAYYNHRSCTRKAANDAIERQADAYGARLLIDPAEYARLEAINPDQHWLAEEFGVSVDAIFAYERHCLTRLRGVTYTRSRMGARQWTHRARPGHR